MSRITMHRLLGVSLCFLLVVGSLLSLELVTTGQGDGSQSNISEQSVSLNASDVPIDLTLSEHTDIILTSNQADAKLTVNPLFISGLLDDFNRPDGPIGSSWVVHAGIFNVVDNAARGDSFAIATYNGATGNSVEGDVEANDSIETQYTGFVLDYGVGVNNLYIKVQHQGQDNSGKFTDAACYTGNYPNWSKFGLGFFSLDAPFATAHMKVTVDSNRTVTIVFSNIDGGSGTQTYVCTNAPAAEGTGVGIVGYQNLAQIDNFAVDGSSGNDSSVSGRTYEPHTVLGVWSCPEVTVSAGQGLTTVSDNFGDYILSLQPDIYDISFSKLGYHTLVKEGVSVSSDEATDLNPIMFKADCWGTDQVCFNELINVIPYLGAPSELGGALNSLCEANRRIEENDDKLGALTIILPAMVDIAGVVADIADIIIDTFDGLIACVEGVAYNWFETLLGPEGARDFSRSLWGSMFPIRPMIIFIETDTTINTSESANDLTSEPIDIHIYSGSEHLGVVGGEVEYTIPSSYLFRMNERYQVAIVKAATANYDLHVNGVADATYDLTVVNTQLDGSGTLIDYKNLTASSGSNASINLNPNTVDYTLNLDNDGDGNIDEQVTPSYEEALEIEKVFLPITSR